MTRRSHRRVLLTGAFRIFRGHACLCDVVRPSTCSLQLTVSAPDGKVDGLPVLLLQEKNFETIRTYEGRTDADGSVSFENLPSGYHYGGTATREGMVPATHAWAACRGEPIRVEATLQPADAWFEGKLVDAEGRLVDGQFSIVEAGKGVVLPGAAAQKTVDGRFRVGVRGGYKYNLYGVAKGYRSGSTMTLRPSVGERRGPCPRPPHPLGRGHARSHL